MLVVNKSCNHAFANKTLRHIITPDSLVVCVCRDPALYIYFLIFLLISLCSGPFWAFKVVFEDPNGVLKHSHWQNPVSETRGDWGCQAWKTNTRRCTHSTRWGWTPPAGSRFSPWPGWCELWKPSARGCSSARCPSPPSSARCLNCAASRSRRSRFCLVEMKSFKSCQSLSVRISDTHTLTVNQAVIYAALRPSHSDFSWRRLQSCQHTINTTSLQQSFYTSVHLLLGEIQMAGKVHHISVTILKYCSPSTNLTTSNSFLYSATVFMIHFINPLLLLACLHCTRLTSFILE